MTEYQIQPPTRRCAVTGRELKPGERFFTALIAEGDQFLRKDYCSEAWQAPPPGAFAFWKGLVPADGPGRRPPVDDELLVDCFERLQDQEEPGRVRFRYVLALLLMRRKRLRFEETRNEAGREVLRLRCIRSRQIHDVVNPGLSSEELAATQDEVFKVLGWQ